MKIASLAAAAALFCVASPAFATSTILCQSTISPTDGPRLWLVTGNAPGSGVIQARLEQGSRRFATGEGPGAPVIGQSWLDRNSLRLAIVDANAETELVRLETWRRAGTSYRGTLRYGGRSWQVRCTEEG
ncbi:MAG TPA: hypothetical protein VMG08_10260 [Allosphingosinicella sp.]|nr:hypothetical protein [Allosphingosinicella sp.]